MNYIKYLINKKRLYNTCKGLIEKYEDIDTGASCKEDLLAELDRHFVAAKREISEWQDFDTDYIHIAHNQLHMASADLLSSGKYHMIGGYISSATCAPNLRRVFSKALDWFETRGELSKDERKEYEDLLQYNISHYGR